MRLAAASLIFLTVCVVPQATFAEPARPNVVLCMADDQGWGDVQFRNPVLKTPVMDELARTALHFTRFYAAAPVCSPTRGSVLTGRHPNRFGCFKWGHTLRPQEVTVAEALKQAGYVTGHFGKWHLGPVQANSSVCPGNSGFDEWFSSPNFYENSPLLSHNGKVIETQGESSHVTVDLAIGFIRAAVEKKKPFLAVVWFGSPHGPHVGVEEYLKMYPDQPKNKANFYAEITAMDHAIGLLREELRKLKVADNTVFWYTSDNGALPVGSTGGLRGKKGNVYEGGIRVPAMIEWPARIKEPRTVAVSAGTVDIYPTLLEIAGVKIEHQPVLDGISLVPLIDGKEAPREKPLGFWDYPIGGRPRRSTQILRQLAQAQKAGKLPELQEDPGKIAKQYPLDKLPGHSAWIDGEWKLHRQANKSGSDAKYSLYHLAQDNEEKDDLAGKESERLENMKRALLDWQQSVIRSLNGEDYREP